MSLASYKKTIVYASEDARMNMVVITLCINLAWCKSEESQYSVIEAAYCTFRADSPNHLALLRNNASV